MSNEIIEEQISTERVIVPSGLLLSVEPIADKSSLSLASLEVDDDNEPADTDTEDNVGDTDQNDDTDTDTTDDADGTD
jgi:hypothetical protein